MNYYVKKLGHYWKPEGFSVAEAEKLDCTFWHEKSVIYFGQKNPKMLEAGDVIVLEIESTKKIENHALAGIYRCLSRTVETSDGGPHTLEAVGYKWAFYVDVECLTPKFSNAAKVALESGKPALLHLSDIWKKDMAKGRLPYNAEWGYITKEDEEQIAKRIKDVEKTLK